MLKISHRQDLGEMKMHPFLIYQDTKFRNAELNRRAEYHRMLVEARQDRHADRKLSARPRRRPGTVLQDLLPAALTGSRR